MVNFFSFLVIFITLVFTNENQNIIDVLEEYNKAFGEANYSKIIECFDLPSSFNLKDKTIMAIDLGPYWTSEKAMSVINSIFRNPQTLLDEFNRQKKENK